MRALRVSRLPAPRFYSSSPASRAELRTFCAGRATRRSRVACQATTSSRAHSSIAARTPRSRAFFSTSPARHDEAKMATENVGRVSFQLKTPKGTRDWMGADMILRERIFETITGVFKRHGGTSLDTPVFELKEILAGKYGEDSKLIYDLADQGGELCALRYDLTVPFARWLAMNTSVQQIKRYQLAKVYRRDQPAVAKGRMREFFQCDFDTAGVYDPMIPDAEILRIVVEVFESLGLRDEITIKLNHRKILDGLFAVAGVQPEKIRSISSAVDKLDKMPWDEVKKEMLEKGLPEPVADKIGEYVKLHGSRELVDTLKADAELCANEDVAKGLEDLDLLFRYTDALEVTDKVSFDLSLARGLDYYTGLIYEVVAPLSAPQSQTKSKKKKGSDEDLSNDPSVGVGSLAAGGRYDNLVNMFSPKRVIPCVGISFGVERIFTLLKARLEKEKTTLRSSEVDVYVMAFGGKTFNGFLKERMTVAGELWKSGIKAEYSAKVKPKLPQQFKAAEASGVPIAVILGEDELAAGKVRVKVLGLADGHPDKEGHLVAREDLVSEIKKLLAEGETDLASATKKLSL